MTKKHIVFLVPAAHGHVNPTLGVASALLARGYRITYGTEKGPLESVFHNLGFDVVSWEPLMRQEGYSSEKERKRVVAEVNVSQYIRGCLKQLLDFLARDPPSLIVYDYEARFAAESLSATFPEVPTIQSFPSFAYNDAFTPAMAGDGMIEDDPAETRSKVDMEIAEILSEYGVTESSLREIPPYNIVFIPRFFQCKNDTFDQRFSFVGPSLAKRPNYGRWNPPEHRPRIVLISLGTSINAQPEFFMTCIAALKDLDAHFVMSVGRGVDITSLQPVPENFEIYPFVSHLDVLPHSSVYVGHGGMGSTMEAIWHGVPLLLSPQGSCVRVISDRVVSLGLGRKVSDVCQNPNGLRDCLCSLLEDAEIRRHVKKVASELKTRDAVADAVAIIEQRLLREHPEGSIV